MDGRINGLKPAVMPKKTARAFAPATVANVGPGFDVFGFALAGAGDTVEARRAERPGARLVRVEGDGGHLPRSGPHCVVTVVAQAMLRAARARFGAELYLTKGLPLGSGLGSSAASAAATAMAVNALLTRPYGKMDLVGFARLGEKAACGTPHADNVAPAISGGFTLLTFQEPLEIMPLPSPPRWWVAIAHPHLELPTRQARAALRRSVPRCSLTANVGAASGLVAALYTGNLKLFGRALMGDTVVEPVRAKLIRGYAAVKAAALANGAAGLSISGAGPSVFAVAGTRAAAERTGRAMRQTWRSQGVDADILISRFGAPGTQLI